MAEPQWAPTNSIEQAMADALAARDGAAYARALRRARLLIPEVPPAGSEAADLVAQLLPPGVPCLPAFTSPESLAWGFGGLVLWYEELSFAGLQQRWPDPRHQLAVNPGCPIATYLPLRAVADLAEGREQLTPLEELQQQATDQMYAEVRRICLQELAGGGPAAGQVVPAELRDDPPVNALESALQDAVASQDVDAYLYALLDSESVLILTAAPVTGPEAILDEDFPWRVLGGDQGEAVAVFSSPQMLARTGAAAAPRVEVDFLQVVAGWPGEDHLLYVNPGSQLELMLPGEAVLDLLVSLAESLEESGPPH